LALDYGIRLLVIALAAWWGSRWVSAPMQQLARAAETLGQELPSAQAPCTLDERRGTVEVRETAQVFNRMAQELQRQFQARSLLMAAISHDLRTPLTRLRMRLELLGLEPRVLERSVSDLRELNALVEQALALYQGHALQESAQTCDLDALLQSLCDDLAEQGQPIRYNSPAAPDEAARKPAIGRVQPQALRRVLNNLISNALRYGGSAELQLLPQEPGGWQIRIDDAGPGIPEAQLQAVFQAFYRLDSSRNRDTGGSGLGLYIAQELAAAMGAQLSLHNRPEGGLSARLSLPPP
jgi:signal transduction histidine kinase